MKQFISIATSIILSAAVMSGCKKGPSEMLNTAAPAAAQQSGWSTYDLGKITISAPHNYRQTPPKPKMPLGDGEMQPDPPPPPQVSVPIKDEDGLLFTLYHQDIQSTLDEAHTRMELLRESGHSKMTEAAEQVMKGQNETKYDTVDLPIGKAGVIKTKETNIKGDEISRLYYVVVHDGNMYKFVWETYSQTDLSAEANAMMQTLRFKP